MNRTYVRVSLKLTGPWRVGAWMSGEPGEGELRERLTVLRSAPSVSDVPGQPYVPGSGIAGSLRAHLRLLGADVASVMGPEPPKGRGTEHLTASPWWVLGAVLPAGTFTIADRAQTSISRRRRAARAKSFRRAESITPVGRDGPHLVVYLRGDVEDPAVMLDALSDWKPRIGGGRSTGHGRGLVLDVWHRTLDLTSSADLLALVSGADGGPDRVDRLVADGKSLTLTSNRRERTEPGSVSIQWEAKDGFGLPPTLSPDPTVGTLMHGTGWKGLLRSRVEFIGRSLGLPVCGLDDAAWEGCGTCEVCTAFGSTSAAGAWEFQASQEVLENSAVQRTRIAVDRFTGGTRTGALWPERSVPTAILGLTVLESAVTAPWVGRALLHAVRDVSDGIVGVGPRSGTGLGTLTVKSITLTDGWAGLSGGSLTLADVAKNPVVT